jgi:bifunctional UDP-N-acetylglucosamine pyrophosphorylase/glucosamine-1-phosphate N-acetyltransferase
MEPEMSERRDDTVALVLAAGQGTRMKSDLAKVLHPMAGEPLLAHVLRALRDTGVRRMLVVIGHQRERVQQALADAGVEWVIQAEQRGTGHAVQMAKDALAGFTGTLLVLPGDTPLLRGETLRALLDRHRRSGAAVTILSTRVPDPSGYGRVVRDPAAGGGGRVRIVEERDATPEVKAIDEINSAIYAFQYPLLEAVLGRLTRHNAQGEYYLTDTPALIQQAGHKVEVECAPDWKELLGVNTPAQLAELEQIYLRRPGRPGAGS